MNKRLILTGVVLFAIGSSGMLRSIRFAHAAGDGLADDNFGYTVDLQAFDWVDVTGATQVVFPSTDNSFAGPIPIGFSFSFYENDYTNLYISTNGLLSFGQGTLTPINTVLPFSAQPNDLVALFWDDLDVGGDNTGNVYYEMLGTAPNRIFVVEFENVTRVDTPGSPLTFEALLFENGNLCLQYAGLSGDLSKATAGIEDMDGIDGIDQSTAIGSNKRICFIRPPASARVKLTPDYASGFTQNRQQVSTFTVKNIGELGVDSYELEIVLSQPGWTAEVIGLNNPQPLTADAQTGNFVTGPIPQGGSISINLLLTAAVGSQSGEYVQATLTAISQLDPGASASASGQAAVPTVFAQIYRETLAGVRLHLLSSSTQLITPNLAPGNPGGVSIASRDSENFFVFWERNYLNGNLQSVSDIEYSTITPIGVLLSSGVKLTNQSGADLSVRDKSVAAAVNEDGTVGVVFIRDITDTGLNPPEINSNIYVAVLDADGGIVSGPTNLTMNPHFRAPGDLNEPIFRTPRISADGLNFAVTWIDNRLVTSDSEKDDVKIAIINPNGSLVLGVTTQAGSTAGVDLFVNPVVSELSGGRALIAYARTDTVGASLDIRYAVRNSTGTIVKTETLLPDPAGSGIDAVQLDSGEILLGWISESSNQVYYAILDPSYNLDFGPAGLVTPQGRSAVNLSVTTDSSGHWVITWEDASSTQHIFYALLNSDGSVRTPPMAIRSTQGSGAFITASNNGGGNAPLNFFLGVFMPLIDR